MHQLEKKQLAFKENKVRELFSRFAGISDFEIESISHGRSTDYRNKVVFHGMNNQLGFYRGKSHDLVPIRKCLLVDDEINQVYQQLQNYLATYPNEKMDRSAPGPGNDPFPGRLRQFRKSGERLGHAGIRQRLGSGRNACPHRHRNTRSSAG